MHARTEREENWLREVAFVCLCFFSHMFVFVREEFRMSEFAFVWQAKTIV
jgi:hypothetical protein